MARFCRAASVAQFQLKPVDAVLAAIVDDIRPGADQRQADAAAAVDRFCLSLGSVAGDITLAQGGFAGVVIAGGAGDNAASACGMGTVAEGQAFVSLGTSGVLFAANDGYQPDPATAPAS